MAETKTETVRGVLRWHGGKQPLARRIVALMPKHEHYCEPYFGGGAVLLAKDGTGVSETANDLDGRLFDFWSVLRCPDLFAAFLRRCEATPFHESNWQHAAGLEHSADPVVRAWGFFVRCRLSFAGRGDDFTAPVKTRLRRGMNDAVSGWLSAVDGLRAVHDRLKRVLFFCRPAEEVIAKMDGPGALFYLDPPYPHSARTVPGVYRHEMDDAAHARLLDMLRRLKGRAMVSGYRCPMYDAALTGWTRHEMDVANNSASGKTKQRRTEVLWCNF